MVIRIGIDFDNTIACYDRAFSGLALDWNFIDVNQAHTKLEVRNLLLSQPDGDEKWQRLQGRIYGAELERAMLFDGFSDFVKKAQKHQFEVFIVSHKTKYGHFDLDQIDLRVAATNWMKKRNFFEPKALGFNLKNVYFKPTREEKINKISELNLDWFIDDLPEVLGDTGFPNSVRPVLFDPSNSFEKSNEYERCISWPNISALIFNDFT